MADLPPFPDDQKDVGEPASGSRPTRRVPRWLVVAAILGLLVLLFVVVSHGTGFSLAVIHGGGHGR